MKEITKNISFHHTFLKPQLLWRFDLLPVIEILDEHIIIGWLYFFIDIHEARIYKEKIFNITEGFKRGFIEGAIIGLLLLVIIKLLYAFIY